MDPEKIKLYQSARDLPPELWDDLDRRKPDEAAQGAGAAWDGSKFRLALLGREYTVDPAKRGIWEQGREDGQAGFQAGLVLLVTLARGMDIPPSGRMATPRELPGGAMFFVGPHAVDTDQLAKRFGDDPAELLAKASVIGGEAHDLGDAGIIAPGLPRIPVYAAVWAKQGGDPSRGVIGLDDRAHLHLPLDALFALTNLIIARLVRD